MSDVAYIMETQDPRELWLVEGENKFRVSRDMYWLLASKGADLPPTYSITELLTENAKLRELAAEMYQYAKEFLKEGVMLGCIDSKSHDWYLQLRELGIEVDA